MEKTPTPNQEQPLSDEEDARFLAIVQGREPPDRESFNRGWHDHAAGKAFHEGPRPIHSVAALCWRFGWNERALKTRGA